MNEDFITLLEEFEKEKGISRDILIDALETALVSAYKRNYGANLDVRVEINRKSGGMNVFLKKVIVETVEDEDVQISLEEATKINPKYQVDDVVELPTAPRTFGRIAAQTARQVVTQRIREAERGMFYNQFADKVNDVVSGVVQRVEKKSVMLRIGNSDAMLMPQEQVLEDNYTPGQRLKLYVVDVQRMSKGPQVVISRTHSGLVKKLFELEVPEITSGVVEIKAVAREAGSRSKIAVWANDPNVDPIGACVGPKGARVQNIVDELMG
ncbi:MAG: transcription termination factor NusA, partial [Clostridia bacterium]|nr:transcription termination factor NusA [Clostridia bacterium]